MFKIFKVVLRLKFDNQSSRIDNTDFTSLYQISIVKIVNVRTPILLNLDFIFNLLSISKNNVVKHY